MPHLSCQPGDVVYIRAEVVEACSDAFQVRIEDFPSMATTVWVPASEVAKQGDIDRMAPMRRMRKEVNPRFYE
jgi:hypothetical protein